MAVKIPSKLDSMSPTFQKAWYKRNKMPLPPHLTGSVKQASKEVKPSERVKKLQAKSIQAYGATKGTKVGGEHGSGEMKDTIAPLTRDQHSKVQAAERAAKAAAKKAAPAKPKKPLSQSERMAAIARAVKKAKSKERFDVPTVNPDDVDHDDLRDVHQSLHVSRSYNEEVESVEEGVATAQKVMDRANVVAKTNPDPKKRFAASGLAQKAMMRTINPTGVNTGIVRGGGNKTYRMVTGKVPPYQLTKKTGVSEEVELDEVTKQEAEKMLGGPVQTRTGSEAKGKLPLGFRRARNLARKAMKTGKTVTESTTEVSEVNEMNHGKKLAKMIMAKQSQHPIAQNMGEAIKDAADVGEYDYEGDMAKSQLRSILANAKRLHDMLEDTTNLPEWVQSKITLAEDYILTAANYMEGEMNEEVEQIDESDKVAKNIARSMIAGKGKESGLKVSTMNADESGAEGHQGKVHFVHHKDDEGEGDYIAVSHHKGKYVVSHTLSGSAGEEKPTKHFENPDRAIAYGRKILGEEVEQIDEKMNLVKAKMGDVVKDFYKSKAPQFKGKSMAKRREMAVAAKLGAEREAGMREEVEQIDEQSPAEIKAKYYHDQFNKVKPVKAYDKEGKLVGRYRSMDHAKQMKPGHTYKVEEGVVTEAEGTVAVTPKEKDLAAHHGDPTRITYGDVIKARLKSAAAKKMGKK